MNCCFVVRVAREEAFWAIKLVDQTRVNDRCRVQMLKRLEFRMVLIIYSLLQFVDFVHKWLQDIGEFSLATVSLRPYI